MVSAVSPDCEIAITMSFSEMIGFLYLNSEAYSTSTGILANSSIRYSPMSPACQEVPHAMMVIFCARFSLSKLSQIPAILIMPSSTNNLPLKVS